MLAFVCISLAALLDIAANLLLKRSDGFRHKILGFLAIGMVWGAFVALSFAIEEMALSVAYATWGALGIVGTIGGGYLFFGERLDWRGVVGVMLVLASIVLLHFG